MLLPFILNQFPVRRVLHGEGFLYRVHYYENAVELMEAEFLAL